MKRAEGKVRKPVRHQAPVAERSGTNMAALHAFGRVDLVPVLGTNDVVNPAAKNDPKSPIAAMPII